MWHQRLFAVIVVCAGLASAPTSYASQSLEGTLESLLEASGEAYVAIRTQAVEAESEDSTNAYLRHADWHTPSWKRAAQALILQAWKKAPAAGTDFYGQMKLDPRDYLQRRLPEPHLRLRVDANNPFHAAWLVEAWLKPDSVLPRSPRQNYPGHASPEQYKTWQSKERQAQRDAVLLALGTCRHPVARRTLTTTLEDASRPLSERGLAAWSLGRGQQEGAVTALQKAWQRSSHATFRSAMLRAAAAHRGLAAGAWLREALIGAESATERAAAIRGAAYWSTAQRGQVEESPDSVRMQRTLHRALWQRLGDDALTGEEMRALDHSLRTFAAMMPPPTDIDQYHPRVARTLARVMRVRSWNAAARDR